MICMERSNKLLYLCFVLFSHAAGAPAQTSSPFDPAYGVMHTRWAHPTIHLQVHMQLKRKERREQYSSLHLG